MLALPVGTLSRVEYWCPHMQKRTKKKENKNNSIDSHASSIKFVLLVTLIFPSKLLKMKKKRPFLLPVGNTTCTKHHHTLLDCPLSLKSETFNFNILS